MTRVLLIAFVCAALAAQNTPSRRTTAHDDDEPRRAYPGGKDLREEALKADHAKSLADAAQLVKLSQELKDDLEKNTRHVVAIGDIKKTEEIEKLAKRIRARMRTH